MGEDDAGLAGGEARAEAGGVGLADDAARAAAVLHRMGPEAAVLRSTDPVGADAGVGAARAEADDGVGDTWLLEAVLTTFVKFKRKKPAT